jgi:hypothetical protein
MDIIEEEGKFSEETQDRHFDWNLKLETTVVARGSESALLLELQCRETF